MRSQSQEIDHAASSAPAVAPGAFDRLLTLKAMAGALSTSPLSIVNACAEGKLSCRVFYDGSLVILTCQQVAEAMKRNSGLIEMKPGSISWYLSGSRLGKRVPSLNEILFIESELDRARGDLGGHARESHPSKENPGCETPGSVEQILREGQSAIEEARRVLGEVEENSANAERIKAAIAETNTRLTELTRIRSRKDLLEHLHDLTLAGVPVQASPNTNHEPSKSGHSAESEGGIKQDRPSRRKRGHVVRASRNQSVRDANFKAAEMMIRAAPKPKRAAYFDSQGNPILNAIVLDMLAPNAQLELGESKLLGRSALFTCLSEKKGDLARRAVVSKSK